MVCAIFDRVLQKILVNNFYYIYFLQEIYCSVCYNKRFSNSLKPDHEQNGNGEIIPIVVDVQPDDCIRCKKKVRVINDFKKNFCN